MSIEVDCPFCKRDGPQLTERWRLIMDAHPVTEGHALLVPTRHVEWIHELNPAELGELGRVLMKAYFWTELTAPCMNGFNVGMNQGAAAGQTVSHLHIHFIPRRDGDVPNPRGGVRGVIPSKKEYKK